MRRCVSLCSVTVRPEATRHVVPRGWPTNLVCLSNRLNLGVLSLALRLITRVRLLLQLTSSDEITTGQRLEPNCLASNIRTQTQQTTHRHKTNTHRHRHNHTQIHNHRHGHKGKRTPFQLWFGAWCARHQVHDAERHQCAPIAASGVQSPPLCAAHPVRVRPLLAACPPPSQTKGWR